MKKFRLFTVIAIMLVAIFALSACTMPWEDFNGCGGSGDSEVEDTQGPTTQLTYSVITKGTSFEPTLMGTAKFKFCPEKVTLTLKENEQEVKPYTTVYAPLTVNGESEYFYILTFNNVIYYDTLKAGEYTATINAYKDGEIAGTQDVALYVEKSLHLFQKFNSTTGETVKCMNADKSDVWINDDFNNSLTENSYYEKSGMSTDGLGQRAYGMIPSDKFLTEVNLNAEGYITYKVSAEEGYVLGNVKLKSYVSFLHAGISDDWSNADIKVQISYDNETFTDVYSLRADEKILDTWIDGNTYYGAKGLGCLNGLEYTSGTINNLYGAMSETPPAGLTSSDVRYYINQEITLSGYVNTVYVRLVCVNKAAENRGLSTVPTRIHNVQITAAQI